MGRGNIYFSNIKTFAFAKQNFFSVLSKMGKGTIKWSKKQCETTDFELAISLSFVANWEKVLVYVFIKTRPYFSAQM